MAADLKQLKDADAACQLSRTTNLGRYLCDLDLLCPSRSGQIRWILGLVRLNVAVLVCFCISMLGGVAIAIFLLPLSGLFMSVLYPTLNSKGISCFRKPEHGAVFGVILSFSCVAAVVGPLAMGAIRDRFGSPKYGFVLATVFAAMLFGVLLT
jgi:fucose permease